MQVLQAARPWQLVGSRKLKKGKNTIESTATTTSSSSARSAASAPAESCMQQSPAGPGSVGFGIEISIYRSKK